MSAPTAPGAALLGTARSWRGIVPFTRLTREGRMTVTIGRRKLLAALGGSVAAWPLAARAQKGAKIPRIGIIDDEPLWDIFRQGLRDLGYIENQNIAIEYRSAESKVDRLAQAVRELVSLPVNIVVVFGSTEARAAQQATSTVP